MQDFARADVVTQKGTDLHPNGLQRKQKGDMKLEPQLVMMWPAMVVKLSIAIIQSTQKTSETLLNTGGPLKHIQILNMSWPTYLVDVL